jgi:hypothetical protein
MPNYGSTEDGVRLFSGPLAPINPPSLEPVNPARVELINRVRINDRPEPRLEPIVDESQAQEKSEVKKHRRKNAGPISKLTINRLQALEANNCQRLTISHLSTFLPLTIPRLSIL